jgi:NADPH2:quinone reductase
MKAIAISETGGPEVLTLREIEKPVIGDGDLLIQVVAAGVNFIDIYQRQGIYPVELPYVLGMEGAGEVVAVGNAVKGFQVGERVAWPMTPGSYAEFIAISADRVVKIPEDVDTDIAAAVMLQGMTAHFLTHSTFQLDAGHSVVIHAAAGGVGQLLTQIAHWRGAHVIATVGSAQKAEVAGALGADEVIRYDEVDDLTAAIKAANGGAGVDVVYDGVGAATFDAGLNALKPRGMMVLFGAASGQVPALELQRLNAGGSLFVTRPSLAHHIASQVEMQWRADDVFSLAASGILQVGIYKTYSFAEAAQAHSDLAARVTAGKLLLIP